MALGLLAHDQGIQAAAGQGRLQRHGTDERIGTEGEAGHRHGIGLDRIEQQATQQRQAYTTEAHRLAIDVMVAAAAGGQGELAVAVGPLAQQLKQQAAPVGGAGGEVGHGEVAGWAELGGQP